MIELAFPFKIYRTQYPKIDELRELVTTRLDVIKKQFELETAGILYAAIGGIRTSFGVDNRVHDWPELKEYKDFLEHHANIYWQELGYTQDVKPKVEESWINWTPKGGAAGLHHHAPHPLSAVLYVTKEDGMGDFYIENPCELLLASQPLNRPVMPDQFDHEVKVTSGDLVIFPSYLRHRAGVNTTDKERIVLASMFSQS